MLLNYFSLLLFLPVSHLNKLNNSYVKLSENYQMLSDLMCYSDASKEKKILPCFITYLKLIASEKVQETQVTHITL